MDNLLKRWIEESQGSRRPSQREDINAKAIRVGR